MMEGGMAADKKYPYDDQKVDLKSPHEIRNWCRIFKVDTMELIKAVQTVGTSPAAVREFLKKK